MHVSRDVGQGFKDERQLAPHRLVGLASWGVVELDGLLQQYNVQKLQGVQVLPSLVNATLCKQEVFYFQDTRKYIVDGYYFCRCMDMIFLVSIFESEVL